ncbi:MAG TPA: FMN-binding protein [Clostridiaceae bacterium]|nr:FMN-binding protein [Clostridiaceae bacterium]
MKKILSIILVVVMTFGLMVGCGGAKYKDGTYEKTSEPDERGNYATIKIVIKSGKIAEAEYVEYTPNGPKDENYGTNNGKIENQENYDKAQKALAASKTFGEKLVKAQDPSKVDVVSGATNSHKTFVQLANEALSEAKK